MNPLCKQLLFLHGHVRPADLRWRQDDPRHTRRPRVPDRPVPPMLRWRTVLRTALTG